MEHAVMIKFHSYPFSRGVFFCVNDVQDVKYVLYKLTSEMTLSIQKLLLWKTARGN